VSGATRCALMRSGSFGGDWPLLSPKVYIWRSDAVLIGVSLGSPGQRSAGFEDLYSKSGRHARAEPDSRPSQKAISVMSLSGMRWCRLWIGGTGTLRREVLNAEWFSTFKQAQTVINNWLRQYSHISPHQALNMRPPIPEI
jgi:hypothetical protein